MKLNQQIYWYILPILFGMMLIEIFHLCKEKKLNKNDLFCSIGIIVVAQFIYYLLAGFILFSYSVAYRYRLFNLPLNHWHTWLICFFADDFSYYWFHRINHKVRFFWASHIVHHSSETFTFSSALRIPWTSNITGSFLFWVWIPMLGIQPFMVILMKGVSALYQFCLHTEFVNKLPRWIEAIIVTPSHHRVHHASDVEYLDKNFGGNMIIWDKLFSTFYKERKQPVYGLTENINSYNPLIVAASEWGKLYKDITNTDSLQNKFRYLFNPPGWRAEGTSKTAKQLQKNQKHQNVEERVSLF